MEWYLAHCNGDWEHQYGVRIATLDNPGWILDVDLTGTPFAERSLQMSLDERSEDDWVAVEASGSTFRARGGPRNLVDLMRAFQCFIKDG
jgi:hypothetical protein